MRLLIFSLALLCATPAYAGGLFSESRLRCEFIQGGAWDFGVYPPDLRADTFPEGSRVHFIVVDGDRATWNSSPAIVYRDRHALTVMKNTATPYLIYILADEAVQGWPALLSGHTAQYQGYCRAV